MYLQDIKVFAKKKKKKKTEKKTKTKTGDPETNNKNIQPGYRNGIWHRKTCHVDNEKCDKRFSGRSTESKMH